MKALNRWYEHSVTDFVAACNQQARVSRLLCHDGLRLWMVHLLPSACYKGKVQSINPLACAECGDSLPFSGASSIPPCHTLFPATPLHRPFFPSSLTSSSHLFLGLPLGLLVSKFIYNTLLGNLLSSILCTCPNHRNLCSLIVSVIVGFLIFA